MVHATRIHIYTISMDVALHYTAPYLVVGGGAGVEGPGHIYNIYIYECVYKRNYVY